MAETEEKEPKVELIKEEKQIIINLLNQISIPLSQAPVVLKIIEKLTEK